MDPKVMKWKLLNYSLVSQLHLVPQTQFVGLACKVVYIRLLSWESAQNLIFFFHFFSIHVQTRTFQNQKKILF